MKQNEKKIDIFFFWLQSKTTLTPTQTFTHAVIEDSYEVNSINLEIF